MFENMKSLYFLKIMFSHRTERNKLKIIKYNKNLKNKIDIYLINYKIFSGKYVIKEMNGKGKEYDSYNDNLIYEGEFKNGERNGKGKEYNELSHKLKI